MAEFFTGGPFSLGLEIVRNTGEIARQMQDKAQEIEWRENGAPALQAQMQNALSKVQEAGEAHDNAEPGSPEERAAMGRQMLELSRAAPRVTSILLGLSASGNKYAAASAQQAMQNFLQMQQVAVQSGSAYSDSLAKQQELKLREEQGQREGELQRGQLELQRGEQALQGEQLAGAKDQRQLAREEMDYKRSQRPLQEEATRADIDRSKAEAEHARAETAVTTQGRPTTLEERTRAFSAIVEAKTVDPSSVSDNQFKAALANLGVPPGVDSLEMWSADLEKEKKGLEGALQRVKDPALKRKIQKRLEEIPKEDEQLIRTTVETQEKRRNEPRWYEKLLPLGGPMGMEVFAPDSLQGQLAEPKQDR